MTSVLAWSNAVFTAILPHISDFAQRAELPIPHPITAAQVQRVWISGTGRVEGSVDLTNGYEFSFRHGYVRHFSTPTTSKYLYNDKPILLNKSQAIERARALIRQLGYSEEQVYANFPPEVARPWKVRGHQFACYEISWRRPNFDNLSVEAKIDGSTGNLVGLFWLGKRLEQPDPVVGIAPPPRHEPPERDSIRHITDQVEQRKILTKATPLINQMIDSLRLPIGPIEVTDALKLEANVGPRPDSREKSEEIGGIVTCVTNGFSFVIYSYRDEMSVRGFRAADCFFTIDDVDVKSFVAKPALSKRQAIKAAKAMIKRFDPKVVLPSKYEIEWPHLPRDVSVPRCEIKWDSRSVFVTAEVDLSSGEVKSVYVGP